MRHHGGKAVNKRLKILMIEKDVKNFEIAQQLKVDPSKISKIVNGWVIPDQESQKRIAGILGVKVHDIWPNNGQR